MRKICWIAMQLSIAAVSCQVLYDCHTTGLGLRFSGFDSSELNTVVVRYYALHSAFTYPHHTPPGSIRIKDYARKDTVALDRLLWMAIMK